ncbi:hypothetical protein RHE_PE00302 (plasmid) [Rhizobium etli CFN 42]|uniref:Uncharacterized protein n=1 Tax=Rhizobium etli (strain ATCC 51251 / DSM 11541 / JCM 21823 / NBRC 15573 / CFN 42) TaxID=347834 RepID=Q2K0U2_RHIEC|nr:hypothetical protein RHE_PE00302 [Rhizobium etli CFN 42]
MTTALVWGRDRSPSLQVVISAEAGNGRQIGAARKRSDHLAHRRRARLTFVGGRLQELLEVLKLHAVGAQYHGDQGVAKRFGYRQVVSGLSHGLSSFRGRSPVFHIRRQPSALTFAACGVTGK